MQINQIKWNNYKKGRIKILKPNEKVVYELVNVRKDALDPERKKLAVPLIKEIPTRDRVLIDEGYVDIAFIDTFTTGGKPVFGRIQFGGDADMESTGKLIIRGGTAKAQAMYEYMEQTNWNASNKERNPNIQPIFRKVNYAEKLKEKRTQREYLADAILKSRDMGAQAIKEIAVALNYKDDDLDALRDRIEEYAMLEPKKFIALCENKDTSIMAIFDEAVKKGFLRVDAQARKIIVTSTSEVLTQWAPESNVNEAEKFVLFVKSDEGSKFYQELKIQLRANKKGG